MLCSIFSFVVNKDNFVIVANNNNNGRRRSKPSVLPYSPPRRGHPPARLRHVVICSSKQGTPCLIHSLEEQKKKLCGRSFTPLRRAKEHNSDYPVRNDRLRLFCQAKFVPPPNCYAISDNRDVIRNSKNIFLTENKE